MAKGGLPRAENEKERAAVQGVYVYHRPLSTWHVNRNTIIIIIIIIILILIIIIQGERKKKETSMRKDKFQMK